MSRARHWVFTLNNYTNDEVELLKRLVPEHCTYITFGYEVAPSTGTPHLQGYVVFNQQIRLAAAKEIIGRRAYMAVSRGSPSQASAYAQKDGVFEEEGELPPAAGSRQQTIDDFKEWVVAYFGDHGTPPAEREYAVVFPALFVRYRSNLGTLVTFLCPDPILETGTLKDWQAECFTQICFPADDRKVSFYVDPQGGSGKTWLQRYMMTVKAADVQVLSIGKRDDIAHAVDETKSIFLFNVPRGGMEFLRYEILEQLKDRMVFSPKYCSRTKIFRSNIHVLVFCNELPNLEAMTRDRYNIIELS